MKYMKYNLYSAWMAQKVWMAAYVRLSHDLWGGFTGRMNRIHAIQIVSSALIKWSHLDKSGILQEERWHLESWELTNDLISCVGQHLKPQIMNMFSFGVRLWASHGNLNTLGGHGCHMAFEGSKDRMVLVFSWFWSDFMRSWFDTISAWLSLLWCLIGKKNLTCNSETEILVSLIAFGRVRNKNRGGEQPGSGLQLTQNGWSLDEVMMECWCSSF